MVCVSGFGSSLVRSRPVAAAFLQEINSKLRKKRQILGYSKFPCMEIGNQWESMGQTLKHFPTLPQDYPFASYFGFQQHKLILGTLHFLFNNFSHYPKLN